MKSARETIGGKRWYSPYLSWLPKMPSRKTLNKNMAWLSSQSQRYTSMIYGITRHVGWFVVTTAMITYLPLIFEYNRESVVEEMERMQVAHHIADGANPAQLSAQGLTSAIAPSVLNK